MIDQTAFAIPKDRQDVTVLLESGMELQGAIFLEYAPEQLTVHHRIMAFLEDRHGFFPLTLKDSSGMEFIYKKNIRQMELTYSPDEKGLSEALGLMQMVNVTVFFTDGGTLKGSLMAEVPAEKARLSDCLNVPNTFLSVKVDGRICYVNKDAIRKVVHAGKS